MNAFLHDALRGQLPTHFVASDDIPWVPEGEGKWARPLQFLGDRGFVELLRMQPGTVMPLHRHTGEIHAYNLSGSRQLCTGEVIGPGDYVYEPPGTIDWWKIVGDEPMVALVVVMGTVEFLDANHVAKECASAQTQLKVYRDYCAQHGLPVLDLVD